MSVGKTGPYTRPVPTAALEWLRVGVYKAIGQRGFTGERIEDFLVWGKVIVDQNSGSDAGVTYFAKWNSYDGLTEARWFQRYDKPERPREEIVEELVAQLVMSLGVTP